jgi:hypothetical protein
VPEAKLLAIYLNDHLAGAAVGVALAKRTWRSNLDGELGAFLAELVRELEEDRATLREVMRQLGVRPSRAKPAVGLAAERVARLKLNGRIRTYSPLSRVLELEGLTFGIEGKLSMWRNLRDTPEVASRLEGVDLDALIERGVRQQSGLGPHKVRAARIAFGE